MSVNYMIKITKITRKLYTFDKNHVLFKIIPIKSKLNRFRNASA